MKTSKFFGYATALFSAASIAQTVAVASADAPQSLKVEDFIQSKVEIPNTLQNTVYWGYRSLAASDFKINGTTALENKAREVPLGQTELLDAMIVHRVLNNKNAFESKNVLEEIKTTEGMTSYDSHIDRITEPSKLEYVQKLEDKIAHFNDQHQNAAYSDMLSDVPGFLAEFYRDIPWQEHTQSPGLKLPGQMYNGEGASCLDFALARALVAQAIHVKPQDYMIVIADSTNEKTTEEGTFIEHAYVAVHTSAATWTMVDGEVTNGVIISDITDKNNGLLKKIGYKYDAPRIGIFEDGFAVFNSVNSEDNAGRMTFNPPEQGPTTNGSCEVRVTPAGMRTKKIPCVQLAHG